jgi:hypothetical protein
MFKHALFASLAFLLACGGVANASVNDGGAMLVHTNDAINFSIGWDHCSNDPKPADCAAVVTQSNKDVDTITMVYVMGIFDWANGADPEVSACQFGIRTSLPVDNFAAMNPCGPNALEIPGEGWPANDTGVAVAYSGSVLPQVGLPLYWFAVYGAPGDSIATGPYPYSAEGAAFADGSSPPLVDTVTRFGSVRWGTPGSKACPGLPVRGGCCLPTALCEVMLDSECESQNGIYIGDGAPCEACSACCYTNLTQNRVCAVTTAAGCDTLGDYPNNRPAWSGWGGVWPDGHGNICTTDPNDAGNHWYCSDQVPTKSTTWGNLRSLFR